MRKTIVILILNCLLISCGQNKNEKKEAKSKKPEQNFLTLRLADNEFIEFNIDTLSDFNEIIKIIEKIDCRKNYALFKLETEKEIFNIHPLQLCEDIFDYKLREIIYINTDSITVNYELKYPIDSLKTVLNNHLRNPNDDKNFPSSDEKKLISINVDSNKNIIETKKLLLKIIANINELNTKANYSFMFEERGIIQIEE
ncbi:hypothetical protein BZARG_3108 [Bizionia argentinensis JUB59]|uniref:Lipoprotein n=1 Tax=Bizionia argentinensis JUB59 TaxID=1046627 RepID=G2EBF5_9FLAO|nr:hypothetical protein [Bizionia argentinensis]EGV44232.1 hypothetical protein BZARG_3108 [Bizionia argentinensis JUB59]